MLQTKQLVIAHLDAEIRVLKERPAILKACKMVERKTGAVNVTRSGSGWRVAPELADDVKCSGLPSGITKDDAYIVLSRDRAGEKAPTGEIVDRSEHDGLDAVCEQFDRAAGVDLFAPKFGDDASIKQLTSWKASP